MLAKYNNELYKVAREFTGCSGECIYQLHNDKEVRAEYKSDCVLLDADKECIDAILRIKKELDWMLQIAMLK